MLRRNCEMDDDIKSIIDKVFTVDDAAMVDKMLDVVNRNISDSYRTKRVKVLDEIIRSVDND